MKATDRKSKAPKRNMKGTYYQQGTWQESVPPDLNLAQRETDRRKRHERKWKGKQSKGTENKNNEFKQLRRQLKDIEAHARWWHEMIALFLPSLTHFGLASFWKKGPAGFHFTCRARRGVGEGSSDPRCRGLRSQFRVIPKQRSWSGKRQAHLPPKPQTCLSGP